MSRFPDRRPSDLLGRLCPRNDESAGQAPLDAAAQGCALAQDSAGPGSLGRAAQEDELLQAQFQRLRGRRGPKKAICAVAASMLTAIYHMLKNGTAYVDPGPDHGRNAAPAIRAKALVRQIERLGFACELKPWSQFLSSQFISRISRSATIFTGLRRPTRTAKWDCSGSDSTCVRSHATRNFRYSAPTNAAAEGSPTSATRRSRRRRRVGHDRLALVERVVQFHQVRACGSSRSRPRCW